MAPSATTGKSQFVSDILARNNFADAHGMLGQWALLLRQNPGVALAFPELQDLSRHPFLILINMQICPFSLFFFFPLNPFFFPHHQWFSALYMLMMTVGARTWFGVALLSQTRMQWCTLPQHPPTTLLFFFHGSPFLSQETLLLHTVHCFGMLGSKSKRMTEKSV